MAKGKIRGHSFDCAPYRALKVANGFRHISGSEPLDDHNFVTIIHGANGELA